IRFFSASAPPRAPPPFPTRRSSDLLEPDLLDLLLGRAQPLHDVVDPLRELLGAHLEALAQLRDQHVLTGQEVVGVATDQRLDPRSEEHTSELQSRFDLVCRLLLEKK